MEPLHLEVAKPGQLIIGDRGNVSRWIKNHLRVLIVPYHDRDSLETVERAVLEILDPPFNLRGRPATALRERLTVLRREIITPVPS